MQCVDNIHVEKYERSICKVTFRYKRNALVFPTVHALDIPQVLYPYVTVMLKYSNAKFEFPIEKFFKFALRSWGVMADLNKKHFTFLNCFMYLLPVS